MSTTCDYTFDSVVRIVIVTVVITLLIIGFFITAVWLYLCKRNTHKFDISYDPNATQLSIIKSNQFNHNNNQSRFAFDNPYFRDDENEFIATNNDKLGFNYNNEADDAAVLANGSALQNDYNRNQQNNPILNYVINKNKVSSTRSPPVKKGWEWEDSDLYEKPEIISVDLIGHDFTGLGFNIRGNMRDGIFIKDVLSRGPANESKKIKPGDKVTSLTISMKNMVYEDALTILSYASPYNVTLNLERENQKTIKASKQTNLRARRSLANHHHQTTISHPLYKTRSVDNLIQIGRYENYGTAQQRQNNNDYDYESDARNSGYGRMINKFKQQIITYLNPTNVINNNTSQIEMGNTNDMLEKKNNSRMKPLSSIQNLFKSNKTNWPDDYRAHEGDLNAVVVGNNLAFKDDDEDEDFRQQYQLSKFRYQQQQSSHSPFNSTTAQPQSLQTVQTVNHQHHNQATNLIKYPQIDLSQVDSMHRSINNFVNINLNDINNQQKLRSDDLDYTRKGNHSTHSNDLNDNSLTSAPSQSFTSSVPLIVDLDTTNPLSTCMQSRSAHYSHTTVAEIHAIVHDDENDLLAASKRHEIKLDSSDFEIISVNKPRSSSMNDLQSTLATMNPHTSSNLDTAHTSNSHYHHQSNTLERAISLDLSNQTNANQKSAFTPKFSKDETNKNRRLIKMKNQSLKQSLGDLSYEMLSQPSLNNSLQSRSLSTSNEGKLSNTSKSIRNSLSTNSTCSSPSLPSASSDTTKMEYDDASILMLKSSPEENNSILVRNSEDTFNFFKKINLSKATGGGYDDRSTLVAPDDELDAKESILLVNDQHKTNSLIENSHPSTEDPLFGSKVQAQKIISDVFNMSSIRTLNSIKNDEKLNDLFYMEQKESNSDQQSKQSKTASSIDGSSTNQAAVVVDKRLLNQTTPNISNFKISSTKKEFPIIRMSSLSDENSFATLFSANVPSSPKEEIQSKILFSINGAQKDDSINKENELIINQDRQAAQQSVHSNNRTELEDEISQLKNRVSKLKKEFSLRQKEIEDQNRQNNVNKFRKLSDSQKKSVLSVKENRQIQKPTGSIIKKQE